jgi:hypothetical protein
MQLSKENMLGMIMAGNTGNDILTILDLIETEYNHQMESVEEDDSSTHSFVGEVTEYTL